MIRRITMVLEGRGFDGLTATAAFAVARRLNAQVEAVFIRTDISSIAVGLGEGPPGSIFNDLVEAARLSDDERSANARAAVEDAARQAEFPMLDMPSGRPGIGVSFRSLSTMPLDIAVGLSDLVVVAGPHEAPSRSLNARIEHLLLMLRRPVLIARGKVSPDLGGRVLVPFNAAPEASTALIKSIDILAKAKSVEVLHLREREHDLNIGAEAARYLGQHGINAKVTELGAELMGIGEQIAEHAKVARADLIVMGAYGRSRLRELILGGATRHLFFHSPVPVILAH